MKHNKKVLSLLATAMTISLSMASQNKQADVSANGVAAPPPVVYMNGEKVEFDVQPRYVDGRAYVPFRKVLESLGAKVEWDQEHNIATATKDGLTLVIPLGSKTISLQGHNITMDVPVIMIDDRNLVPLRFVAQALGARVDWKAGENSNGDRIDMTQNYEVMVDRMVNGKNAAGDMKVNYEQAAILFEWIKKGQDQGKLPAFTGMDVPQGKEWHYLYTFNETEVSKAWDDLKANHSSVSINETEFIKTQNFRIQKHDWVADGKLQFNGLAVWDVSRNQIPGLPPYEGIEKSFYIPER